MTSYIGKKVYLLPMTRQAMNWAKNNRGKRNTDWSVVTLLKWEGEDLTVRAGNGKRRLFGPLEATWQPIESADEKAERLIKLVQHEIAAYVDSRAPSLLKKGPASKLADELRAGAWRVLGRGQKL